MSSEQIRKRQQNRNSVLRMLHFQGASTRGGLSAGCGIRKSSVTTIVQELLKEGLLKQEHPGYLRSRVLLNPESHHALVAQITPQAISFARISLDGSLTRVGSTPITLPLSPEHAIDVLCTGFEERIANGEGTTMGLGIALPGPIDPDSGVVLASVNLGNWRSVALREAIASRFEMPVIVDNDVRAQLWSCAWFDRLLAEADSILYIGMLQGVACATILHGQRVSGSRFLAGEIGHVRAGSEGRRCNCGKEDCLETYCGLPRIVQSIREECHLDVAEPSQAAIAALLPDHPEVDTLLSGIAERLAHYVAGLVVAMDPQMVVLGSEDEAFSKAAVRHLGKHLYSELLGLDTHNTELRTAEPTNTSTLKGIGGLVIENAFAGLQG
ncbi:MAG: ROK family protein [Lentisphaerae bacterium]|nr:ROK family protein [Lentisphaerota bacterium]